MGENNLLFRALWLIDTNRSPREVSMMPHAGVDFLIRNNYAVKNNWGRLMLTKLGTMLMNKLRNSDGVDEHAAIKKPTLEHLLSVVNLDCLMSRDIAYVYQVYMESIENRKALRALRYVFNCGHLAVGSDARIGKVADGLIKLSAMEKVNGAYQCTRYGEDLLYVNSLL